MIGINNPDYPVGVKDLFIRIRTKRSYFTIYTNDSDEYYIWQLESNVGDVHLCRSYMSRSRFSTFEEILADFCRFYTELSKNPNNIDDVFHNIFKCLAANI